ncbi:transmembrane protein, putative (macronuclear) [Tetrahymena thermophila SB210]|uniref:Transmembrane protein, putative n=1 Tax=Tetrahymena thermophila (strain SB210) TaxID=312017 RepID=I7M262_TETTS|nr:transmembrane protein, putative [Tetrahymena thermophila SB210]EAR99392.1 transmembrane protein, putative [Tetrahymena thermophila SB210]|eukprot:XP_001019637.1 transmembrane protein, putative [Tetrahymena thermophila SB210]
MSQFAYNPNQQSEVLLMPKPSNSGGFDITAQTNNIQQRSFQENLQFFAVFMVEFLLDCFVVFPLYLFKMLFESFRVIKQKYDEDQQKDYKKYLKLAGSYFLDIVLPLSVVGITFKTVQGKLSGTEDVYYIWCENCFVFFLSFILLISYLYNINQKDKPKFTCSFKYLMRQEHLETLGLGVIHNQQLKQLKSAGQFQRGTQKHMTLSQHSFSQDQMEFNDRVAKLAKELNIDLSLFFFDLLDNKLSKSTTQKISKDEIEALKILKNSGIQAKLSARDKILWPIYEKSIDNIQQESAPFLVFAIIICLKVIIPLWYLIGKSKLHIDLMSILNISGFYIYMISILYTTMNNQDLKRRNFIIDMGINKLCDFKYVEDFTEKLDVTCPLSLETWDNSRRIFCQIDQESTTKFELSYIFLGFYYIFIGLICVSIYGEIYIIISPNSVYLHPLMVIHTTADFMMVTIFFFIRIWYSSEFNENFQIQIELINELIGVYDDLIQMYDTYFSEQFQQKVSNPLYKKMVQQIIEKSRFYTSSDQLNPNGQRKERRFRGKVYTQQEDAQLQIEMMKINRESLEKVKNQIIRDEKIFKHKMFGKFDLSFKETVTTVSFGLLTVAPTIFNKLQQIFDPQPVNPPPHIIQSGIFHKHK